MQINMAGFYMGMRITADNISNNKMNAGIANFTSTGKQDTFGPQCKVTISHEGRRKSDRDKHPGYVSGTGIDARTGAGADIQE